MGLKSFWLIGLAAVATQVLAADRYTDGNRPYEFGFNIDGEQHRHEKKDENGLIEGEFGFITADGVYHVTAYATDENGNFRIRSTKNIRIGSPVKKVPEGKALEPPKSPTTPPPSQIISCSHCSIPELTKPPALSDIAVVSQAGQTFSNYPENSENDRSRQFVPQYVETNQLGDAEPQKPVLISAQMQIVDQNTDIYQLAPGEQPGLPNGVTNEYLEEVLYRFNYTVGFHAHYEEGYRNGFKKGYYYITGRNEIKTRVDYVADNDGFHPRISQEVLDALSDDVPKPETEQEERYGLKGYEFKWLYYPVLDRRSNQ